jgi:mono/diheme cytochrome c family protein
MSDQVQGQLGEPPLRTELPRPPFFMIGAFLVLTTATWIPLVVFARARVTKTDWTRVHIVQDMDNQPKYKAQDPSEVFADGRAMRLPITGTVKRGGLDEDDHFFRGFSRTLDASTGKYDVKFFDLLPPQVPLSEALLKRGQERYNIYCSVCHGSDGYGNGPVNARAVQKQERTWVPAANLHTDIVRGRPNGHLFNTATNGIRNMAGYGAQISTEDRWAIVAYVRALQLSQRVPADSVPREKLDAMR